jgi:hypothetical protein
MPQYYPSTYLTLLTGQLFPSHNSYICIIGVLPSDIKFVGAKVRKIKEITMQNLFARLVNG